MREKPVKAYICKNERESWDTYWKWSWFTRKTWMSEYWEKTKTALEPVFSLLSKLNVRSILDCSCGLGFKTVMFAKMGYEVEGSDASAMAIKYAPQLAKEQGFKIKFFHSLYEELPKNTKRRYDCVFSDYFDEIETYERLKKSAKGIYSVLKEEGKFIFYGVSPKITKSDLKRLIERDWQKRKRFVIDPPVEQNGLKVTHIEIADKTKEGILENHIYLIEEKSMIQAEIAFIMNSRIKWAFKEYVKVLKESGFRKIRYSKREGEEVFIIAIK
jgi:SAM-dependent methyltransferase